MVQFYFCARTLWKSDAVSLYFLVLCHSCELDWPLVLISSSAIPFGSKFKESLKNMHALLMSKILAGKSKSKKCFQYTQFLVYVKKMLYQWECWELVCYISWIHMLDLHHQELLSTAVQIPHPWLDVPVAGDHISMKPKSPSPLALSLAPVYNIKNQNYK